MLKGFVTKRCYNLRRTTKVKISIFHAGFHSWHVKNAKHTEICNGKETNINASKKLINKNIKNKMLK